MLSVMSVIYFHCEAGGIQNFFPNLMYIHKGNFDLSILKFTQGLDDRNKDVFQY